MSNESNKQRKIGKVMVVKNSAFAEYAVQVWDTDGKRWQEADYYTSDKKDAAATAKMMKDSIGK